MSQEPSVFWSITAARSFAGAVARQAMQPQEAEMRSVCDQLLAAVFPGSTVFVLDRLGGFSPSKPQHVLTLEVFPPKHQVLDSEMFPSPLQQHSTHVAKIGHSEPIQIEIDAWKQCMPHGLENDPILLPLYPGPGLVKGPDATDWACLLYADAEKTIGEMNAVSLEHATIHAALYNLPRHTEVALCTRQSLARLRSFFYNRSRVLDPATMEIPALSSVIANAPAAVQRSGHRVNALEAQQSKMDVAIQRWHNDPAIRRVLDEFLMQNSAGGPDKIGEQIVPADPVTAVDRLMRLLRWLEHHHERLDASTFETLSQPLRYLPPLRQGFAHGDLHGRNILLGQSHTRAEYPTVFDYETAGTQLLIGWDHVKLEFELACPALGEILEGQSLELVYAAASSFFADLLHQTHHGITVGWEETLSNTTRNATFRGVSEHGVDVSIGPAATRLKHILLQIRREALSALDDAGDPELALQQYQFLSTLYATASSRYRYNPQQRMIALVAGGVATSQARWHRKFVDWHRRQHRRFLGKPEVMVPPGQGIPDDVPRLQLDWQTEHEEAKLLLGSDQDSDVRTAIAMLRRLLDAFPHAAPLYEDLAYAHLRIDEVAKARSVVDAASDRFDSLTSELYCRLGRIEKDAGHEAVRAENLDDALAAFDDAARHYCAAFQQTRDYYPGINLAAVHLAQSIVFQSIDAPDPATKYLQRCRSVANLVRESLEAVRETKGTLDPWQWAALAESAQLTRDDDTFSEAQHRFLNHPKTTADARNSFQRQQRQNDAFLQRILDDASS